MVAATLTSAPLTVAHNRLAYASVGGADGSTLARTHELAAAEDALFVTAGHPAPTLGEPVPPSQRGTRGFASAAIGSSQSETVTGSREGNMSY